jgi:hypothetical protein
MYAPSDIVSLIATFALRYNAYYHWRIIFFGYYSLDSQVVTFIIIGGLFFEATTPGQLLL